MDVGVHMLYQNYQDWKRYNAKSSAPPIVPDSQIYDEDLHLGSLVEPLGFDSMWAIDHSFSPYVMTGNAIQNLTYFAGQTKRLDFGTMIIVLPWYDPIVVAEQIAVLDNMLQGRRFTIGLGRGAGQREFDSYRIPLGESRGRFMESLEIVRKALTQEWFSHEGEFYTIPETTIRPRPRTPDLVDRMKVAWVSPESLGIAANAGLGMLFTNQKSWDAYQDDFKEFNAVRAEHGWAPLQPTVVVSVSCAESEDEAWDTILKHTTEMTESIEHHYQFGDSAHFKRAGGYEYYETFAETLKSKSAAQIGKFNAKPQAWGTPAQCLEKLQYIKEMTSAEEFVLAFRYGGMPADVAERSMRLFAKEVLPALQAMDPAPLAAAGRGG